MLEGMCLLITGAGSGLGRETSLTCARYGATVGALDVDLESAEATVELLGRTGGTGVPLAADVSDEQQVRVALDHFAGVSGRVDSLVNNAGIRAEAPISALTHDEFAHELRVSLMGPIITTQACLQYLTLSANATIVNVASIAASTGFAGRTPYTAAKGGVVALTRSLAMELGPSHIRVNAVSPGPMLTEMTVERSEDSPLHQRVAESPLGRYVTPQEVSEVIAFLASSRSGALTGQTLTVDGGLTACMNI